MVPMIIIILGLAITGAHLIYLSFPSSMDEDWIKIPAAIFLGIALALAFITVLGNKDLLKVLKDPKEWSEVVVMMAIFDAFLLMIFFEVFEKWEGLAVYKLLSKIFISCLISFLVFIFVTIFIEKKKQSTIDVKNETKIHKLQQELKKTVDNLANSKSISEQLKMRLKQLNGLQEDYDELLKDVTCKHCEKVFNARSLASHENRCKSK